MDLSVLSQLSATGRDIQLRGSRRPPWPGVRRLQLRRSLQAPGGCDPRRGRKSTRAREIPGGDSDVGANRGLRLRGFLGVHREARAEARAGGQSRSSQSRPCAQIPFSRHADVINGELAELMMMVVEEVNER